MLSLRFFSLYLLIALLVNAFSIDLARAAEILQISEAPISAKNILGGSCTHALTGEISPGDAQKLSALIDSLPAQNHDDENFVLCLNSGGGNLDEGLAIGQLVFDNFFGTFLPKDSTCLSSCAIIFMHGRVGFLDNIETFRVMHASAKLGFHSPRLRLSENYDGMVPLSAVDAAYANSLSSLSKLAERSSQNVSQFSTAIIPSSLLSEILRKTGKEFAFVETFHQAFLWDIGILPSSLGRPQGIDIEKAAYQICDNLGYVLEPQTYTSLPPDSAEVNARIALPPSFDRGAVPKNHTLVVLDSFWSYQCSYFYDEETSYFDVRRYAYDGEILGRAILPWYFILPPKGLIKDLRR